MPTGSTESDRNHLTGEDLDTLHDLLHAILYDSKMRDACITRPDGTEKRDPEELEAILDTIDQMRDDRVTIVQRLLDNDWNCPTHGPRSLDELDLATDGTLVCKRCTNNYRDTADPAVELDA